MSKRAELRKEFYRSNSHYRGTGTFSDNYVKWLEDRVIQAKAERNELLQALEYALQGLHIYAHKYGMQLIQLSYIHETENAIAKAKGVSDE